jgi:hypothetical protein
MNPNFCSEWLIDETRSELLSLPIGSTAGRISVTGYTMPSSGTGNGGLPCSNSSTRRADADAGAYTLPKNERKHLSSLNSGIRPRRIAMSFSSVTVAGIT